MTTAEVRSPEEQVAYWDRRWQEGPRCPGSVGDSAARKAQWLSTLVRGAGLRSVVDWGCGDGTVASMLDVPEYLGVDVSHVAIQKAIARNPDRSFLLRPPVVTYASLFVDVTADVAVSMDVVFHLLDADSYHQHLARLFGSAVNFVAVYATDFDSNPNGHMRHRNVTDDVDRIVAAGVDRFADDWGLVHGSDDPKLPGWMLWERA